MITRLAIKNFRCLRDVSVVMDDLTVLIGANGAGKSSAIRALEAFFGHTTPDPMDCWQESGEPIEVTLTLEGFDADWTRDLDAFLVGGALNITRRWSAASPEGLSSEFVTTRARNPDFVPIDGLRATEAKPIYETLRKGQYGDLPRWTSLQQATSALLNWERENPDTLVSAETREVGLGSSYRLDLSQLITLVTIQAISDARAEATETRAGMLSTLLNLMVKPHIDVTAEIGTIVEFVRNQVADLVEKRGAEVLKEAASAITRELDQLTPGSSVMLDWDAVEPQLNAPRIRALLTEEGHRGEIGRQGHGVQRAYLFALLRALLTRADSSGAEGTTVLAIEEPELYQHPIRVRHFARVLRALAEAESPPTQLVYATHSPLFISVETVDTLRRFRIERDANTEGPVSRVERVNLEAVAQELRSAQDRPTGEWSASTLRPRLAAIDEPAVSEAFFADAVVVVEGIEDKAFIEGAAAITDLDLDAAGIAVVPVHGKGNIDRPLLLCRALGIPTFTIFDGDRAKRGGDSAKQNRALLRLLGEPAIDFPDTAVRASWAAFEDDLPSTVASEIGAEAFNSMLNTVASEYGYAPGDGRKNGAILGQVLRRLYAGGTRSTSLDLIVSAIKNLPTRR